jgi:predicted metal-dependent HD superfamily phosphohydrolase
MTAIHSGLMRPNSVLDPHLAGFISPEAWAALWHSLGSDRVDWATYTKLMEVYAEPHRAYHNLQHLAECLEIRHRLGVKSQTPHEVDLALWFHDAIYDPSARDSEGRSAQWLDDVACAVGLDADVRTRLHALVMVTCHDAAPRSAAESTLVDADLAILGASPSRFDDYCRQIREEYRHVPSLLYRIRRRQILQGFSNRSRIYTTEAFHLSLEEQARDNLRRAIDDLS